MRLMGKDDQVNSTRIHMACHVSCVLCFVHVVYVSCVLYVSCMSRVCSCMCRVRLVSRVCRVRVPYVVCVCASTSAGVSVCFYSHV